MERAVGLIYIEVFLHNFFFHPAEDLHRVAKNRRGFFRPISETRHIE